MIERRPERPRRPLSEYLEWKLHRWVTYHNAPAGERERPRDAPGDPGVDAEVARSLRLLGYISALVLPALVGAALIPLRETITNTNAALMLVVTVVVVALVGGPGPGAVGALVAAGAFDLFLTRPYYRPVIHAADDVETAVLLLLVGLLVGQLVAREAQARTRAAGRGRELNHLRTALEAASHVGSAEQFVRGTERELTGLLGLRSCRWAPGYHGQAGALLTRSGKLWGTPTTRLSPDLGKMPEQGVELPVEVDGTELGRFILKPRSDQIVSLEERATAIAIADVFAIRLLSLQGGPTTLTPSENDPDPPPHG